MVEAVGADLPLRFTQLRELIPVEDAGDPDRADGHEDGAAKPEPPEDGLRELEHAHLRVVEGDGDHALVARLTRPARTSRRRSLACGEGRAAARATSGEVSRSERRGPTPW